MQEGNQIISAGLYRSGSALIYQYLQNLFPDHHILKTHRYNQNRGIPVVMTIRNIKDCLTSYWRVNYPKEHNGKKFSLETSRMTENEIIKYIKELQDVEMSLRRYIETHKKVLILRYEKFNDNPAHIHKHMNYFFKLKMTEEMKKFLEHKTSKAENLKIQQNFSDFTGHDPVSHIHGDHIFNGDAIWKTVVPSSLHHYLNSADAEFEQRWDKLCKYLPKTIAL